MSTSSKGPRVTVQPASATSVPQVSFASPRAGAGFLAGLEGGVQKIADSFVKSTLADRELRQKQLLITQKKIEEEQKNDKMRNILGTLNNSVTRGIEQIKNKEITPSVLKSNIRGQLLTMLSEDKGIDPKSWSTISALVKDRVDEAGATHYVSGDKTQYVYDSFGGVSILNPGTAELDEKSSFIASFGTKNSGLIATYMDKLPESEQKRVIAAAAKLHIESEMARMNSAITENKIKTINLGIKQEAISKEEERVKYDSSITDFLDKTANAIFSPKGDPNDAAALLSARFAQYVSEDTDFSSAGYTDSAQVVAKYGQIINQYKALFKAKSQFGEDDFKVKKLDVQLKLRLANMKKQLSDSTLFSMETGQQLMNVTTNTMLYSSGAVPMDLLEAVGISQSESSKLLESRVKSNDWISIGKRTFDLFDKYSSGGKPDATELFNYVNTVLQHKDQYDAEYIDAVQKRFDLLRQNPAFDDAFNAVGQ